MLAELVGTLVPLARQDAGAMILKRTFLRICAFVYVNRPELGWGSVNSEKRGSPCGKLSTTFLER
jgi:hypothetical protein